MKLFNRNKSGEGRKAKENYAPQETPLGPRTYPKVGGKVTLLERFKFLDNKKWWWIGGGALLLVVILLIVVFSVRSGTSGLSRDVTIEINGPERVALGSDVAYEVKIINNSNNDIINNQLFALYPDGFSYTTADPLPSNSQGTEFEFERIERGTELSVFINGRLTGGLQTEQVIIARLQFRADGGVEDFRKEATFTTTIETAAFSFDVDGPASVLPNNEISFDIDLENNQDEPLANLRVQALYPGGFSFIKAEPAPTTDDNVWDYDQLGISEKQEIRVTGTLGGNIDEVKRFVFEAGAIGDDGEFLKQTEIEKIVKINQPSVTVTQSVNGKETELADADTPLLYAVNFANTGPTGIANLVIEVEFNEGVWDLGTLRAQNGGSLSGNLITWDGVGVPALRNLEAGQTGEVVFSVSPKRTLTVDDPADKHFQTTTKPRIKIGSATLDGNPVTVKYRAQISVGASASVVTGPNPPEVGQETVYEVTWNLSNQYNDLSGARLVGEIPAGAEFELGSGRVSVGEDLAYDSNKKQLLWNIGRVPANVGKLQPSFSATFRIKITPAVNEAGLKKLMVTSQEFSAKDDWTGEQRKEAIPDVESERIP